MPRELAGDSLELFLEALPQLKGHPLCSLPVWGSVVGLFELNNLSMEVTSPLREALEAQRRALMEGHVPGPLPSKATCLQDAHVVTAAVEALEADGEDLCEVGAEAAVR